MTSTERLNTEHVRNNHAQQILNAAIPVLTDIATKLGYTPDETILLLLQGYFQQINKMEG